MKKIILVGIIAVFCSHLKAGDSLRVYIVGQFYKGETFKIHTPTKVYCINFSNPRLVGYYFYLSIDSTINDGSLLPIVIEKKKGKKYYNVELMCFYQADRKYFILWKDKRQSKTYPFIERWEKTPLQMTTLNNALWSDNLDSKFIPAVINESKYNYYFTHLDEFYKK